MSPTTEKPTAESGSIDASDDIDMSLKNIGKIADLAKKINILSKETDGVSQDLALFDGANNGIMGTNKGTKEETVLGANEHLLPGRNIGASELEPR